MHQRAILWFRNDLRCHDNEALFELAQKDVTILPVYVFDERVFYGRTSYGFEKTGKFRKKFIRESVIDLRNNLKSRGADLIVRIGKPEEIIFEIAKTIKSSWVYCNRERTFEEVIVQDELEKRLWSIGQELRYTRGKMLYYTMDLPFPVTHTPDIFTTFRKEIEKIVPVRKPLAVPEQIPYESDLVESGDIPTNSDLQIDDISNKHIENLNFIGGESSALSQLDAYVWETQGVREYYETRNQLLGWEYSSKFSAWLSVGCLSPKKVYDEIRKFESEKGSNKSTYWLYFELLWRDFFRLMGKKYGDKIFYRSGIKQAKFSFNPQANWQSWVEASTGVPIVDACMKQLKETGFMSNRGRQIVASFLIHDLKADWLIGAEYFESMLIDYDPCSNYCNWNYLAGVGNDPLEHRYFDPEKQSKTYDPEGKFAEYWLKNQ